MSNDEKTISEDPSTRPGIVLVDTDGNCIPDQIRVDISWLLMKLGAIALCVASAFIGLL